MDLSRRLAVDRVAMLYLGATGVFSLASLEPVGVGLGALHLLAVGGILAWTRAGPPEAGAASPGAGPANGRPGPPTAGRPGRVADGPGAAGRVARFVRLVYPVLLTPLLYQELSVLNQLWLRGYFDATVQGWETAVFGAQLSVTTARAWPGRWLSELLHLGYVSYYVLVPGAAVATWLGGGDRELHRFGVTVAVAFFACYLVFAAFPVAGPRYLFPPVQGEPARAVLYDVVHRILEAGSSKGTAFPSSHVAATVGAWLASRRAAPRWFAASAPFVWLLVLGTVYGRFHYGVDAAAGLAVGGAAWLVAPAVLRRWGDVAGPKTGEGRDGA